MADQGDAAFHEVDTDPDFTEARTRLFDYQRGLLASQPDVTSATIGVMRFDKDTSLSTGAHQLLRLIIPPGHNLALDRCFRFKLDATVPEVDPSDAIDWFCVSGNQFPIVIDLEDIEANRYATQLNWEYTESFTSLPFNVGELWWTNLVQTVQGIQQSQWPDNQIPTLTQTQMLDGSTFNRVDGPPRRRLNLTHVRASAADLKLYEELTRRTAYGARPFWYEHPDSGDAVAVIHALDTTDDTAAIGDTTVSTTGTTPSASGLSVQLITGSGGTRGVTIYTDGSASTTGVDARNKVLQMDVQFVSDPSVWNTLTGDCKLRFESPGATSGYSEYFIGDAIIQEAIQGEWVRYQVDLEDNSDSASPPAAGALDHGRLYSVEFIFEATAVGQVILLSGMKLIDKAKMPLLVEAVGGVRKTQSNPQPSNAAGPYFDVSLDMAEVTT